MSQYALINENTNIVENIIEYDPENSIGGYTPEDGYIIAPIETYCEIGYLYKNNNFIEP